VVLVTLVLTLAGAALAAGASASVPGASNTASKKCQSYSALNARLDAALSSGDTGKVDTGAVNDVAKGFRSAAKSAPKSLKSAMNTIADVANSVSHTSTPLAAAAELKKAGPKITSAVLTWGTYLAKNCTPSPSTS
jgi:hypothetical protein